MGPTPFSVGYLTAYAESASARFLASMGPTPFSVGYPIAQPVALEQGRLQWGQRLSALDTRHIGDRRTYLGAASMGPTPFSVGYLKDGQRNNN